MVREFQAVLLDCLLEFKKHIHLPKKLQWLILHQSLSCLKPPSICYTGAYVFLSSLSDCRASTKLDPSPHPPTMRCNGVPHAEGAICKPRVAKFPFSRQARRAQRAVDVPQGRPRRPREAPRSLLRHRSAFSPTSRTVL